MNVETATQCARGCPRLEEGAPQPQLLPPQPSGKRQGKRNRNSPRSIAPRHASFSVASTLELPVHQHSAPSTQVRRSPCLCAAAGQATSPYGSSLRSRPPGLPRHSCLLPSAPGLTSQLGRVSTIPHKMDQNRQNQPGPPSPKRHTFQSCPWMCLCAGHAAQWVRGARRGAAVPSPLPAGATMA